MKVLKFGGTSVSTIQSLKNIHKIVQANTEEVIVVFSAISGVTNLLKDAAENACTGSLDFQNNLKEIEKKHIDLSQQLLTPNDSIEVISTIKQLIYKVEAILTGISVIGELTNRALDLVLGYGEQMSNQMLYYYLKSDLEGVTFLPSNDLIITKLKNNKENVIIDQTFKNIQLNYPKSSKVAVAPGFIAKSENGYPTTLGRGGSDYTAALYAAALNASILEIWTDVSGIYTADPNNVDSAYALPQISYLEALELSHFGAKVIYPPTIQPVLEKNIPILIKNTFAPEHSGTLVTKEKHTNGHVVKAFTSISDIALVTLSGNSMVGVAGTSSRLFLALSKKYINIILITQASSEHSICLAVERNDAPVAEEAINEEFTHEIEKGYISKAIVEYDLAIVAMVGEGMKNAVGLSGKAFSALGRNGININAIAQGSSELNVSVVIRKQDTRKALNVLHEAFFHSNYKVANLFVVGVGNVGKTLMQIIEKQAEYFKNELKLQFRIVGIANSKKMLFSQRGIDQQNWSQLLLTEGEDMDADVFISKAAALNIRNSIFIDNTASENISNLYTRIIKANISVVTCNKIAASSHYENYLQLKQLAKQRNVFFRYESNVGAGLPVINTLNNLVKSGDKIEKIEAVLSGSLNFILNKFHQGTDFSEAVAQAMKLGYTEPDPRIDLSGKDVMRKLLILMRESGYKADFEDIKSNNFLPENCLSEDNPQLLLQKLAEAAPYFNQMREKAEQNNKRLRFVAAFDSSGAHAGLIEIDDKHPFFHLEGSDNIIVIHSRYYNPQPLVIKGAGAGAQVTASGIFSDIISIVNS